jgi:hypothetical protein
MATWCNSRTIWKVSYMHSMPRIHRRRLCNKAGKTAAANTTLSVIVHSVKCCHELFKGPTYMVYSHPHTSLYIQNVTVLNKSLLVNGLACSGQTPALNDICQLSRMASHPIPCPISLSIGLWPECRRARRVLMCRVVGKNFVFWQCTLQSW